MCRIVLVNVWMSKLVLAKIKMVIVPGLDIVCVKKMFGVLMRINVTPNLPPAVPFTDSAGQQVAYLYRTLDTGECNQNTAGCQPFSLQQDDKGQWKDVAATDYGNYSTGIYLNKKYFHCL